MGRHKTLAERLADTARPPVVRKVKRPRSEYQKFLDKHLDPLFREAEAVLGVKAVPFSGRVKIPSAKGPNRPNKLPDSLEVFIRTSSVATWMQMAQLLTVMNQRFLGRMTGIDPERIHRLFKNEVPSISESRAVWFVWSLVFCPSNLSSAFNIVSWGFFNEQDKGHIRLFELDRVRRGFCECRFEPRGAYKDSRATYLLDGELLYRGPFRSPKLKGTADPAFEGPEVDPAGV